MIRSHRFLATVLAVLLVSLVATLMFSQWRLTPNVKANPAWLTGWTYRKSHVVNYASGAGTNYQVKITCYYGSGSDSGGAVYLSSHSRTDFGDVRFTDNDETTLLNYWMESKTDSDNAVFWVEVADDLSSSAVTIYVYYGKSDATTTSNGENTAVYFTDFPGASLPTGWTTYGTVSYSVASSQLTVSKSGTSTGGCVYRSTSTFAKPMAVRFKAQIDKGVSGSYGISMVGFTTGNGAAAEPTNYLNAENGYVDVYRFRGRDGGTPWATNTDVAKNTLGIWEVQWKSGNGKLFFNDVQKVTRSTNIPSVNLYIGAFCQSNAGTSITDWMFVRKYVDPEPSHGSWGSEETEEVPQVNSVELKTPNDAATETSWSVNFVFNATFYQTIQNASLHLENTTVVPTAISWSTNNWNTSAVLNNTETTRTFDFSSYGEGTYKWNVEVFNSTHGVFASSNRTLTVDVPPRYQNVDSNSTSIQEDGTILLYGQGYDGIGLDWAVLATNETGSWNNYTSAGYTEVYVTDFTKSSNNPLKVMGAGYWFCAFYNDYDGKIYILMQNDASPSNDVECWSFTIANFETESVWTFYDNVFQDAGATHVEPHSVIWETSDMAQARVNDGSTTGSQQKWRLYYAGGTDDTYGIHIATADDETPTSWTEETNIGTGTGGNIFSEDSSYHNGELWLDPEAFCYNGSVWLSTKRYSTPVARAFFKSPDGINDWTDVHLYAGNTAHLPLWGTAWEPVETEGSYFSWISESEEAHCSSDGTFYKNYTGNPLLTTVGGTWEEYYGATPALVKAKNDSVFIGGTVYWYYQGRDVGGTRRIGVATSTTLTTVGEDSFYDSPMDMNDVADTWSWSNFTWCNTTITSGTTIQWRIYYNDTYGNVNATGIQTFQVISWEITINTATHSWSITAGQTDILINEGTISITVSAPANFDIQVKGSGPLTNGSNTIALSNVKVNYTGAAISLTTEYQTVPGLANHASGTDIALTFQLWLSCPSPQPTGDYVYTLTVKIREAS